MNPPNAKQVRAEAASWVTRLHGPARNVEVELGLKRWLAEDPAHAAAFELATEVWQETADLPATLPERPRRRGGSGGHRRLAVAAMAIGVLGTVTVSYFSDGALTTDIGEQRTVALEDGTRVELNTNSQLVVKYDDHTRTVILKSGEAFFDVAKRPERPFVVLAGSRKIVALGTTFVVRRDTNDISVILVEGKVAVSAESSPSSETPETSDAEVAGMRVLTPGQRLRLSKSKPPQVDQPSIEKVTSWQRGQLIFEDTPLREAAAEFNRYGSIKIEIASRDVEEIPVGGVFRIGDFSSFAHAVAASHHLQIEARGERLILTPLQKK